MEGNENSKSLFLSIIDVYISMSSLPLLSCKRKLEPVIVGLVLLTDPEATLLLFLVLGLLLILVVVHLHEAVAKLARGVLAVAERFFAAGLGVEMHLELGSVLAFLCVHLVLEIGEELLQSVEGSHESDIGDD